MNNIFINAKHAINRFVQNVLLNIAGINLLSLIMKVILSIILII